MISGIVPFEEIVQSVKDETGIENIRPFYEKIRRLIFRGEREIGYGGTVVLYKKIYAIAGVADSNPNFGKYFKFPEDFIELEGIGQKCKIVTENKYMATSEGVRFKEKQSENLVLLYWGLKTDDNGYPMVTRNHEEAVIAFVVWKLYSAKIFLGIGNMNANKNYEESFISALLEARGDDAFPTLEQWNALGELSFTDRRTLIDQPVHSYDYCAEYEDAIVEDDNPFPPANKKVYYWSEDNATGTITEIIPIVNPTFLLTKNNKTLEEFQSVVTVENLPGNGNPVLSRICFAVNNTENLSYLIYDGFNNNITPLFDVFYYGDTKIKLYVSQSVYSFYSLGFKIQNP
jgi:hypothetical protein